MRCRYTNRVAFVWVVVLGLVALMAATVRAQEAPIEVHSVDLRTNETLGTVVLGAEKQVEWSTEPANRTLVVFLPHTVPGPDALDRSSRVGLISLVEVGFAVPGGVPTTRVTIHAREPFTHELEGSGTGLTIRLRTAAPAPAAAPAAAEPVSSVNPEDLEKALEETERLRKRVAELHSDRLELRESLARAQQQLAERPSAAEAGAEAAAVESENARLIEEVRSQRARLAESQAAATRASAQIEELTQRLAAAQDRTEAADLASENQRLTAVLEAQESTLAKMRQESARVSARARELEAAAQAGESADALGEDLARSAERERQLSQQLRESRSATTSLRAWLSKAPAILGASTFVVSSGDSCLPLRPEPISTSAVLKCLPSGSRLEALSFRPDWLRVRAEEGKEGWVSVTGVSQPEPASVTSVRNALDESRSEVAGLTERVAGLEGELAAAQSRAAAQDSQAAGLAELESQLAEERTAREAAEGNLRLAQARLAEREREATQLGEVESRSAEVSRELNSARENLQKAQEESEAQKRKLRALLAQVALGQPTISEDADPCLTVRAGPGTEHRRMDCLVPGTALAVQDAAADWLSIRTDTGLSGWVASKFVESNSVAAASERADSESLAASAAELDRLRVELEAAEARNRASLDRFEQADAMRKELDQALAELKAQQEVERTEALSALKVPRVLVKEDIESCLSLRAEPRVGSKSLDCLAPGTEAATVALSGGWFRLRLEDDREGWSSGEFLESVDQRDVRRLAARAAESNEALNRERDTQRQVQQELVERDELIADLRNQLAAGSATDAELERQNRALEESRAEVARMTRELAQAEDRRIADLDAEQQGRAGLEGQLEAAREEIGRLGALAGRAGEVPILESALESARRELESSEARVQALEANRSEAESLEERVAALDADLAQAREALAASEARSENLSVQAAEAGVARSLLSSAQAESSELAQRVAGLEAELTSIRESLSASEARNEGLSAQVAESGAAQARLSAARAETDRVSQRLAGLEEELASMRESLSASEARNESLSAQVAESAAAQARLSAARAETDRVSQRLAGLEEELTSTRESLSASQESSESLAAQVASLEAAQRAQNADGRRAALQRQVTALQEDLSATRETLAKAEARNQALEAHADRLTQMAAVSAQPAPATERAPEPATGPVDVREPLPAEVEQAEPAAPISRDEPAVAAVTEPATTAIEADSALPNPSDLEALAKAWARAWSQQRVDDYLSYYGSEFVPPRGMKRAQWEKQRRERLLRPEFVEVTLSNYRTRIDGPDRAMVAFDQEYRSNTFQDRVVKSLELSREGGLWRIVEEIAN